MSDRIMPEIIDSLKEKAEAEIIKILAALEKETGQRINFIEMECLTTNIHNKPVMAKSIYINLINNDEQLRNVFWVI